MNAGARFASEQRDALDGFDFAEGGAGIDVRQRIRSPGALQLTNRVLHDRVALRVKSDAQVKQTGNPQSVEKYAVIRGRDVAGGLGEKTFVAEYASVRHRAEVVQVVLSDQSV